MRKYVYGACEGKRDDFDYRDANTLIALDLCYNLCFCFPADTRESPIAKQGRNLINRQHNDKTFNQS